MRGGFDDDAEVYQRTRPVCPPELFDDLMRLAHLSPGDRVLEIAPGTGQATVPLAERGLAITAVELGTSLAAVVRRRLASFPAVEVVTSAFEDWRPQDEQPWNAVIVFNALHWIDPEVRYAKSAALLRPGLPGPASHPVGHQGTRPRKGGRVPQVGPAPPRDPRLAFADRDFRRLPNGRHPPLR